MSGHGGDRVEVRRLAFISRQMQAPGLSGMIQLLGEIANLEDEPDAARHQIEWRRAARAVLEKDQWGRRGPAFRLDRRSDGFDGAELQRGPDRDRCAELLFD